jgi:hypothetical protein
MKEDEAEDPGLRLTLRAKLEEIRQNVRWLLTTDSGGSEELLHPLELCQSVGLEQARFQLVICVRWRRTSQ